MPDNASTTGLRLEETNTKTATGVWSSHLDLQNMDVEDMLNKDIVCDIE